MKKRSFTITMIIPLMVLLLVFTVGCKQAAVENPAPPAETFPVEDIDVKPKQPDVLTPLQLSIGESKTFTATVTPENATNKKVVWSFVTPEGEPADSDICELKDNGDGTCTVTGKKEGVISLKVASAADSTKYRIVHIEVKDVPVTGIEWTDDASGPLTLRLVGGSSYIANVRVLPENATNKKLTYSVGTEGIIEVTPRESSFVLKGKSQGSTTFTVTTEDGGFSVTRDVNVIFR